MKGMIGLKRSFLFTLVFSLFLAGCQTKPESQQLNNQEDEGIRRINVQGEMPQKKLSPTEVAERLVKIATKLPDVKDATAIVAGKYAIVGIDVDAEIDRSKVGTLKFTVTEALQKDPYGANAVVSADADIVTRIKKMAAQVRNGKPIVGIMDELAAIVGRIIPEIPDESHQVKPDPTEENEDSLPEGKENKLDEQQDEQSNHHLNDRGGQENNNKEQGNEQKNKENETETPNEDE
jgi:YhcN/YlaJ family sporulation lipoprotein